MIKNKERVYAGAWYLFVFAFLYIWFTQIHPLILFDSDDWLYVAYVRRGIPLWGNWNPAKLFPETLMPMVCSAAVHLLYPLTGDYVGAIMVVSALLVSLFLTVYIWAFTRLIRDSFSLSTPVTLLLSALFFLLHFLALRSEESANQYLFYCWDVNCYYNYLIPGVLNAILVMLMANDRLFPALWSGSVKKGFFLLAVYLAVFSNLASSGVLAAYAGSRVLLALVEKLRKKITWKELFRETALHLGILTLWLVSAVFELSGGRASGSIGGVGELLRAAANILEALSHPTVYSAKAFLLLGFLTAGSAAAVWLLNRKKRKAADKEGWEKTSVFTFVSFLISGAALLVYMVLLMAVVEWTSVRRSEYLFVLFFYLLLLVLYVLCYVVKKCPDAVLALPVLLYVLLTCTNTTGQTFRDSNMDNYPAEICAQITNDLIDQFIQADAEGVEYLQLRVPDFPKDLNWPLFEGENSFGIADSLYEHGVTRRRIEFTSVPDPALNEKYQLHLFE